MTKRNFPPTITTPDGSFIMSPKNDFAFRLLFGDEKNKEITIAFLKAMLHIPIEDIKIKDPYLLKQMAGDKTGILDIRIVLDSGVQVDVEIQLSDHPAIRKRVLYYNSKLYMSQISAGDGYNLLNKTISLVILDYNLFKVRPMHTTFRYYDPENGIELADVQEVHIVELPKLKYHQVQNRNDPEIPWLMFLNAATKEELIMAAEAESKVAKAYDRLRDMSEDEESRRAYEERITEIIEVDLRMHAAEERGREEGREEGIELGEEIGEIKKGISAAKKMISLGMDDETIIKVTELPAEKITQLRSEAESE